MSVLSSMGIGSSVLTSDTLDKLKENTKTLRLTGLQKQLDENTLKSKGIEEYSSLIKDLSLTIDNLSREMLYLKRNVTTSNNSLDVKVSDGIDLKNFKIETLKTAKNDTFQSKLYSSKDDVINSSGISQNLTLNFKGKDYNFIINNGQTLSQLNDNINNTLSKEGVSSSILNIGNNQYSMVLSSQKTGIDNKINISGDTNILNDLKFNNVQVATNSQFKYNGISMERSGNNFNDLIIGIDITLKEENTTTEIKIKDNKDSIKEQFNNFVEQYNKLSEYTKTMPTVFKNDSMTFNNILRDLNHTLTDYSNGKSLFQYGLELDKNGLLSMSNSKLDNLDMNSLQDLFSKEKGVFSQLNTKMGRIINSNSSLLNQYKDNLKNQYTRQSNSYIRTEELINIKFETMKNQFNSYDSLISKMNSNFSSLSNTIYQSFNTKG